MRLKSRRKEINRDVVCHKNSLQYENDYNSNLITFILFKEYKHLEQGTGIVSYNCTVSF